MRIRMRTTIANAQITAVGDSVVELPEKEAKNLLASGFAELVKEKAQPQTSPVKNDNNQPIDFGKYPAERLTEFAKKANLDPKITNPQTIIKKLQELKFDPEAK